MPAPLDFYFDFSSPYGYFASREIEGLAARHGRTVVWRPILLGAVFKVTGQGPLLLQPLRGPYATRDLERTARLLKAPFRLPTVFPVNALAASRAFYWLHDRDPAKARTFARAAFDAIFGRGEDLGSAPPVVALAKARGLAGDELAAALEEPAVKARLKDAVDAAVAAGVFGSPFVVVDGEPFWGHDRFAQIDRWLSTGGW